MSSADTTQPNADAATHCDFCGKPWREVGRLIAGRSTFICARCVKHCAAIVILGKDQVYDKADMKRARAEARKLAFAEVVTLMDACETERRPGFFGGIAARLRRAGGLGDG